MSKFYAGIGSRETPPFYLKEITAIAHTLKGMNYVLRSGGAAGADSAFENGAYDREIFEAKHATQESMDMAAGFHPNWDACNNYVRRLHGRNMMILFGKKLDTPVDFVVCWTPGGKAIGGTGQALRAADYFGLPIINLGNGMQAWHPQLPQLYNDQMMQVLKNSSKIMNKANAR